MLISTLSHPRNCWQRFTAALEFRAPVHPDDSDSDDEDEKDGFDDQNAGDRIARLLQQFRSISMSFFFSPPMVSCMPTSARVAQSTS